MREFLAALQRCRHEDVAIGEAGGQHGAVVHEGDGRLVRRIAQQVETALCGITLPPGLFQLLLQFAAFGARAQEHIRGGLSVGNEALAHPEVFVEHRHGGLERFDGADGGRVPQPRLLHIGGELPHGGAPRTTHQIPLGPRRGAGGKERVVEDRQLQLEPGLLPERQRGGDIGGEALLSQQLIERAVGRIDEVADVHDPAELRIAGVEAQRRQEATVGFAHSGVGATKCFPLLREREVLAERLIDVAVEQLTRGAGRLGGHRRGGERGHRGCGEQRHDGCGEPRTT